MKGMASCPPGRMGAQVLLGGGPPGRMEVALARVLLGGEEVPEYLLYLSTCRRHRRDDTLKGSTLLLQL